MLRGIDISNNQATIDWPAVASSGTQFCLAKASGGAGYTDRYFPGNLAGMRAAGIAVGAYHYCLERGYEGTPEDEADWFLDSLAEAGGLQAGEVVAGDFEEGAGDLSAWALAWLQRVEAALGAKPLLYSSPSFITEHGLGTPALAEYGLWIANYGVVQPTVPKPWTFYAVWQHSATGSVPGVSGACDLDVFNGSLAQWALYGLPKSSKRPFDVDARLALISYLAGGSGVQDVQAWLSQYEDAS